MIPPPTPDANDLTDAEVDSLLDRFDQTEPALQRRIIAAFVCRAADRDRLAAENAAWVEADVRQSARIQSLEEAVMAGYDREEGLTAELARLRDGIGKLRDEYESIAAVGVIHLRADLVITGLAALLEPAPEGK